MPPAPTQETEYVIVALTETNMAPEVAIPVSKFAPEQEVAFVEYHVSVVLAPDTMVVGPTAITAVGKVDAACAEGAATPIPKSSSKSSTKRYFCAVMPNFVYLLVKTAQFFPLYAIHCRLDSAGESIPAFSVYTTEHGFEIFCSDGIVPRLWLSKCPR